MLLNCGLCRLVTDNSGIQRLSLGKLHKFPIAKLKVDKCRSCGEDFFTTATDEQITASLRSTIGLLPPEEIRRQLGLLGITQRTFASHLRIAPETVSRWMTGLAIQNRALDTLMRIYFAFPAVRQTLGKAGSLDMSNRDRVNKLVHRAKA